MFNIRIHHQVVSGVEFGRGVLEFFPTDGNVMAQGVDIYLFAIRIRGKVIFAVKITAVSNNQIVIPFSKNVF